MAEVLVRDLDVSVVEKLKARAAANGRSLPAE
jgi:plasmid stability protein